MVGGGIVLKYGLVIPREMRRIMEIGNERFHFNHVRNLTVLTGFNVVMKT